MSHHSRIMSKVSDITPNQAPLLATEAMLGRTEPEHKVESCISEELKRQELNLSYNERECSDEGGRHANESRDEQEFQVQGNHFIEKRANHNDNFDIVLNTLENNISCANASTANRAGKKAGLESFRMMTAFEKFLRMHNCEPLLDSDDDSFSCYHNSPEHVIEESKDPRRRKAKRSQRSSSKLAIKSSDAQYDNELADRNRSDEKDEKQVIFSLQHELSESRKIIQTLKTNLSTLVPRPDDISHLVNQKRELDVLVVGKRVLEAQLEAYQEQLVDARHDIMKASAAMKRLSDDNKRMEDEILELTSTSTAMKQKLADIDSKKGDCDIRDRDISDLKNIIHQLHLELNQSQLEVKRIEKERKREKNNRKDLAVDKSEMERRIEQEIKKSLEVRRKCYVLEQKNVSKKKREQDLEAELKRARDEIINKDCEHRSLLSQVEKLKAMYRDGDGQLEELSCLRDINESLNAELAASMDENRKLKHRLRCSLKLPSYRRPPSPTEREEVQVKEIVKIREPGDNVVGRSRGDIFRLERGSYAGTDDVFSDAVKYLSLHDGSSENNITHHDVGVAMMQDSRTRFGQLRSDFSKAASQDSSHSEDE